MQAVLKRLSNFGDKPRIYILPTKFGYLLAFILFVMLLGAINYSNSMAHLLVFLLVSLCHIAMLYTHKNIAKIKLKYASAEPVFMGESAQFNVVLDNQSDNDVYQVKLALKKASSAKQSWFSFLSGFENKNTLPHIQARQTATATVQRKPIKRGYQALGKVRISSHFPLGLFVSWTQFDSSDTVLVYPRPIGELPLPSSLGDGEQSISSSSPGHDDFAGFKKYRSGDPHHAIAWKSLAKNDVLRTKQFTTAQNQRCIIRWEDAQGYTEVRLSQLCKWLVEADKQQCSIRLELPKQIIDFGVGQQHLQSCLTALALYEN